MRAVSSMRFLKHNVVPGRRGAASPEPITTNLSNKITAQDYGLPALSLRSDVGIKRRGLRRARHPCAKTSSMMRHVIYAVLDLTRSPCGNTDTSDFSRATRDHLCTGDVTYVNVVIYGAGMESTAWEF
jgi:hypothetical protein